VEPFSISYLCEWLSVWFAAYCRSGFEDVVIFGFDLFIAKYAVSDQGYQFAWIFHLF
jgi:hypothetical protein